MLKRTDTKLGNLISSVIHKNRRALMENIERTTGIKSLNLSGDPTKMNMYRFNIRNASAETPGKTYKIMSFTYGAGKSKIMKATIKAKEIAIMKAIRRYMLQKARNQATMLTQYKLGLSRATTGPLAIKELRQKIFASMAGGSPKSIRGSLVTEKKRVGSFNREARNAANRIFVH